MHEAAISENDPRESLSESTQEKTAHKNRMHRFYVFVEWANKTKGVLQFDKSGEMLRYLEGQESILQFQIIRGYEIKPVHKKKIRLR
jgi:hypothetical protein